MNVQRSRDVGEKWDESDAEQVLVAPHGVKWRNFPPREPTFSKPFSPREENIPVGCKVSTKGRTFASLWCTV